MAEKSKGQFITTQWTRILGSSQESHEEVSKSLTNLCEIYHDPVFLFIRSRCGNTEQAKDLCQGFFAMLIEKQIYRHADRHRGKFRSFLLTSVKNYLKNEYRNESRQKRAGGKQHFSIDGPGKELDLVDEEPTDSLFDREWANIVFGRVWETLGKEYQKSGKEDRFRVLRPSIDDPTSFSLSEAGKELKLSESAAKSAAFRLRGRFREIFRDTVAELVESPDDIEDEIRYLIQSMVRGPSS